MQTKRRDFHDWRRKRRGDRLAGNGRCNLFGADASNSGLWQLEQYHGKHFRLGWDYVGDEHHDVASGFFSIDPASVSWRTISIDGSYTIGETASMIALDNIQSVGLYLNAARGANQTNIQFNDFQANATVVPEPAVVGLMGLGAFSARCLRRIRLRKR